VTTISLETASSSSSSSSWEELMILACCSLIGIEAKLMWNNGFWGMVGR